jgi:hypothetical protein
MVSWETSPKVPVCFKEELALEKAAANEKASREAWLAGAFAKSWAERQAALEARRRIGELGEERWRTNRVRLSPMRRSARD